MSVDEQLLGIFREEAAERLDAMVETLLAVEAGEGDPAAVRDLFRHAHSLKGTAAMVGLAPIGAVAEAVEHVLADARATGRLPPSAVGPLLAATDAIRAAMSGQAIAPEAIVAGLPALVAADEPPAAAGPGGPDAAAAPPASATRGPGGAPVAPPRAASALRVAADRVDALLDAAGEAVIHRRRLAHLLDATTARDDQRVLEELEDGDAQLGALQRAVLDLRTLPLSSIVGAFPRAVRDAAASAGREVELELEGVDTQLDRSILEGLSDPIVHLLRNAVAHGIEPPAEREAAGKPRTGRVVVRAEAAGPVVTVTVADDGRGVAPELLARADGPAALADLLAAPGFSTARAVDHLAGRGVGLDAVRRDVGRLGGGLAATSEPGRGSAFTLRVPSTLAVLHVLLVERAGHRLAVPVAGVAEAVRDEPVHDHGGRRTIAIRDAALPLADLGDVLGIEAPPARDDGPVLVLEERGQRVGVRCDRLVGEADVVVKPLGPLLARAPYLGATILEDGCPALVVDPRRVVGAAPDHAVARERPAEPEAARPGRVLVVDDQVTVRELQRTILVAAGYDVVCARDGREALDVLAGGEPVDAVITDLEMPGMDGFALLAALRATPEHASLPVVVLSSRGAEADRRRGAEAGADAYLVKSEFDERTLLATVRRVVIA